MKPVSIRSMEPTDYDAVIALWRATPGIGLNDADSRENVAAFLTRNPGHSQVADSESGIVGAVLCGHDGRRGYLHHLAVAATWRRQGLGRRLTEAALASLAPAGIAKCHLFIFRDNREGIAYWTHNGWSLRDHLHIASYDLI
ncbi:MAG TPA: GNAT family N-acetyltransferase [Patescibacteria group bacterium]|nr:GNAT family N-acetyltransferase [Patescibacteria group bacterium]